LTENNNVLQLYKGGGGGHFKGKYKIWITTLVTGCKHIRKINEDEGGIQNN